VIEMDRIIDTIVWIAWAIYIVWTTLALLYVSGFDLWLKNKIGRGNARRHKGLLGTR